MNSRTDMKQGESRSGERGAALIIVLGLVALISAWAVTAAYEDTLSLRRAENNRDAIRSQQASQSMLWLSLKLLRDDSKESQNDHLDEIWAQQSDAFPIDDGSVLGSITDSNRFINLNTLVDKKGKVIVEVEKQVKALFLQLELDEQLVHALIDWMDADDRPSGAGGAEDASYYDRDYRIKNGRLDRWGELRLVRGFDDEVVAALNAVVMVRDVPESDISTVNINTATVPVLMAVMPTMTQADAEIFISERPFDSVQQALEDRDWATAVNQAYLSVVSDIFMVRTQASFGRVVLREKYLLLRESGKITLLSSEQAGHEPLPETSEETRL